MSLDLLTCLSDRVVALVAMTRAVCDCFFGPFRTLCIFVSKAPAHFEALFLLFNCTSCCSGGLLRFLKLCRLCSLSSDVLYSQMIGWFVPYSRVFSFSSLLLLSNALVPFERFAP